MNQSADPVRTVPEQEGQPIPPTGQSLPAESPSHIGRYRVERLLGEGGFGRVYLAHDDQLRRPVAIKVPHARLVAQAGDAEAYLAEARTVAGLDHANIVPVHDVGGTEQFPCFVVSRYIDGSTLKDRASAARLSQEEAARLVATVAEALHHAHKQGIVHRDVKPGNILLDKSGKPFVADFGLALREQDIGTGPRYAGTLAYMSPEQARGEGHRVDGRSDIFSLGVVLYELLVGRRPFHADAREELREQIAGMEARPPRQWDDTIPKELERICLKALAKRPSERYPTARDLADDLRHFLAEYAPAPTAVVPPAAADGSATASGSGPPSDTPPLKIVPKGLRSFDAHDADFFLELLPGPRDREGLPDSVRFWKTRIEETDPDQTFAVGLIYGPSGCGKSSLVRAGLLPRLANSVTAVYMEATAEETEARLLKGLRRQVADLPRNLGLIEALAALRQGRFLEPGQKLLLVLDQFEQFLHARRAGSVSDRSDPDLVQALRQCDGGRVQCLVLVRDDFWLAVSRFMQALEIVPGGENSRLVDLFDPRHARKVLLAFGRAFGALPEKERTRDQDAFLDQAVAGLSQDGKVISVRLALFAEMVKGKPWAPATLKAVGGTEGVGVTFLEETFTASTAPPQHRLHQKAAQAVLKALLPEAGTDIKGHMRSRQELLAASGYANRPREFDELLRILDGEVRLITPTDPEGKDDAAPAGVQAGAKYYQLTHDYLVHSLREWLTRKQKETPRGRAELLLADRAAVWNARPENRQLPSLLQWWQVRWLTRKRDWTPPQRKMMREATRHHALRAAALLLVLLLLGWGGYEGYGALRAEQLVTADTADVPRLVAQLPRYSLWSNALLRRHLQNSPEDSKEHLHASLALAPGDGSQVHYLSGRLLRAGPVEVAVIRDALWPYRAGLDEQLWEVLDDRNGDPDQRLRAACALARYAPEDPRWEKVGGDVAAKLVTENALVLGPWVDALRPVRGALLPALAPFLEDEKRTAEQRRTISGIYGTYAGEAPEAFARLEQRLVEEADAHVSLVKPHDDAKLALARRQANLGVALLLLGRGEKVWPLLEHSPDPTRRSYLIDRLGPGGVEASVLADRLDAKTDVSIRRALLLALGEYDADRLPPAKRDRLISRFAALYRDDPDPGVHGAASWLLRQWGQPAKAEDIDRALATGKPEGDRRWYVNGQGQTFVVVPRGEFGTADGQEPKRGRIDHRFALAARDVTVAEFQRFRKDHQYFKEYARTEDCPVNMVSWYDAAAYCNWLSQQEGIAEDQWCYLPNDKGEYAAGMRVAADWQKRSGYRLPAAVEWEYACRAGSGTPWSMGAAEELLPKYAWYSANALSRSHPVGSLRPNDWGLFDMHGNVCQWCQDRLAFDDQAREQHPANNEGDKDIVYAESSRPLRGGAFGLHALAVRSIYPIKNWPATRGHDFGFRPARAFP